MTPPRREQQDTAEGFAEDPVTALPVTDRRQARMERKTAQTSPRARTAAAVTSNTSVVRVITSVNVTASAVPSARAVGWPFRDSHVPFAP